MASMRGARTQPTERRREPLRSRLGDEPRVLAFLRERLDEEMLAADGRALRSGGVSGTAVLLDAARAVAAGRLPDEQTLQILLLIYRDHPDFDRRWRA